MKALRHFVVPPAAKAQKNIFGVLLARTLGDFCRELWYCASVKELVPDARLDIYYRPDRPYKDDIVTLCPQINQAWPSMNALPVNLFDPAFDPPVRGPEEWYGDGRPSPDMLILPSMCSYSHLNALPRTARFRMPDQDQHDAALKALLGEGWYIVLHYRDSAYTFRTETTSSYRNFDPEQVPSVIDHIIKAGGQVVRIGHPEMIELQPKAGFLDLKDAGLLTQCHAISRARGFFEASSSGPVIFAQAFGVPSARCNATELSNLGNGLARIIHEAIPLAGFWRISAWRRVRWSSGLLACKEGLGRGHAAPSIRADAWRAAWPTSSDRPDRGRRWAAKA